MRLWVISDLHLRPYGCLWQPLVVPAHDVLVLAGDITAPLCRSLVQARAITDRPAVVVAGNHEHYGGVLEDDLARAREEARLADGRAHLLENNVVVIGSVRFVGATLWTDYDLYSCNRRERAMAAAADGMNDHRTILCRGDDGDLRLFMPQDARALHLRSRRYLARALARTHSGPTVVITHHAPHPGSVHERWDDDPLTPSFVSDLSALITRHQPALWVHGHTHDNHDYHVGATRVICNPQGYGGENTAFDPTLVVEV